MRRVRLRGVELACLERGTGPLVLCLHGFPDTAYGFVPLLDRLAAAGYWGVAPFLRGWKPSGLAKDDDYRITTIVADLIELMDALGVRRAHLVGHDWGAVASYIAGVRHPDRIGAIVAAAVPHPRRFLLRPTLRQLYRSRYMAYFQLPHLPERRIAADGFAWLHRLVRSWSPRWGYTQADLAPVQDSLADPAHCRAALAYYRSLPGVLRERRHWSLLMKPLPVPAKVICGADDGCIGPEMFTDQAHCFAAAYELVRIEGAGHFMHREQPLRFADEVLGFLEGHSL
ncbi:Pimeloyl-ACP methyl ester carboxylesterase [Fontimonas thermophila]|uniref:Pimeloyl-ACP methyl ester carboxylesterase n=1 Tax=Fontimonas thermophila TaxID=1076937 RepID=A0A1I2KHF9_9GAMM|nr:alpha/beta hydrolase [Fontimonas thermophila]SFF65719.1 Pimeloyl-ACP methyl ester carboxylesterase [Fontimonas thermophila]